MSSQNDILSIKRVAADMLGAIDPETGDRDKKAALGVIYQKAFEVWRTQNLFLPEKMLEDGGTMDGARTALFYLPEIPKTEPYDFNDWDWSKIPIFNYKEKKLDIDASFKIQRRILETDINALRNRFAAGDYEYVSSFVTGLVKNMQLSAAIKRNVLIMENLVDQAKNNGLVYIQIPKIDNMTSYQARKFFIDPILQQIANMKKFIEYGQGIVGTEESDFGILLSENQYVTTAETMGIQGSDRSFGVITSGKLPELFGHPIARVPYLNNTFSISEDVELDNGTTVRKPVRVDLTGVDVVVYHKNAFAYKFSPPYFKNQEITGTLQRVLTHVQFYPKNRLPILEKFCVGFKFIYEDEKSRNPEKMEPNWDSFKVPADWELIHYGDKDLKITVTDKKFIYDEVTYWNAGEDWANKPSGMDENDPDKRAWNFHEFKQTNLNGKILTKFTVLRKGTTTAWYGIPLFWVVAGDSDKQEAPDKEPKNKKSNG